MKFSIIIATLNRIEEPLLMLDSLKNQTLKDFEILLIDQNEKDILRSHLAKYKGLLPINHIRTNLKGASNARNTGIKKASGSFLTFPDDDCEFYETFLEDVYRYFTKTERDAIVTTCKDKSDGKAISILMSDTAQIINRRNILKTVVEAGIIIRASKLQDVLFDPKMGVGSPISPYWSDEGPDFVLRLIEKGIEFKYCPQFYMFHPNPVKIYNENTALRSNRYGKGRGYFLRKHKFGVCSIIYYLSIYIVGMCKGILCVNKQMFLYFKEGFKGRYEGYYSSK